MISAESLKGYFLEEILAFLIRNVGYRLLVDPSQDSRELAKRGNGIVVQGRGGVHQVDVLGQLVWIPSFTFPIRLFVEAKCRKNKVGLPDIRNAVGVINDINQNYSPIREGSKRLIKRYAYRYALFSTSGFTRTAVDYALAHQVSLIDLSGAEFSDLRNVVGQLAELIISQELVSAGKNFVRQLRFRIRRILQIWPDGVPFSEGSDNADDYSFYFRQFDKVLNNQVKRLDEFFVGMADGPFLLIFKPHDVNAFLNYAEASPAHRITITWQRGDNQQQWTIQPVKHPEAYSLSFGLPKELATWIFSDSSRVLQRAWDTKQQFFSNITIYRHVNQKDYLYRLIYDTRATQNHIRRSIRFNKKQ